MSRDAIEITEQINTTHYAGSADYMNKTIARGLCPFCEHRVSFSQIGLGSYGTSDYLMIPLQCDACNSISVVNTDGPKLFPAPKPEGVEELPEKISNYYDEARKCIQAGAPNGAATLFRKTIHAIAIHYDITDVDADMGIYDMIDELHEQGHINQKLREALLTVKDLGNDGAHINENEPDIEQAFAIKSLIDSTLKSTIKADENIELAREKHPNEYKDS